MSFGLNWSFYRKTLLGDKPQPEPANLVKCKHFTRISSEMHRNRNSWFQLKSDSIISLHFNLLKCAKTKDPYQLYYSCGLGFKVGAIRSKRLSIIPLSCPIFYSYLVLIKYIPCTTVWNHSSTSISSSHIKTNMGWIIKIFIVAVAVITGLFFSGVLFPEGEPPEPQDGWWGRGPKQPDTDTSIREFKVAKYLH